MKKCGYIPIFDSPLFLMHWQSVQIYYFFFCPFNKFLLKPMFSVEYIIHQNILMSTLGLEELKKDKE